MAKSLNNNLKKAKAGKNDEFYTELTDIEKELRHYKEHFKGKTVFCNCDDPRVSNFFQAQDTFPATRWNLNRPAYGSVFAVQNNGLPSIWHHGRDRMNWT